MIFGDARIPARIWDKIVVAPSGCWIWRGAFAGAPQARITVAFRTHKTINVRRLLLETERGARAGECVASRCSGSACVHPDHAIDGPLGDVMRAIAPPPPETCPHGHVYEKVGFYVDANGGRRCKECHNWSCYKQFEKQRVQRVARMSPTARVEYEKRRAAGLEAWTTRRGAQR